MDRLRTLSPIDGRLVVERPLATGQDLESALSAARTAQREWRRVGIGARARLCGEAVDAFLSEGEAIAREITLQMGRPIAHSPGELRGFEERARYMAAIAEDALRPVAPEPRPGCERFVQREPLGVVLTIAPWNYPLLTAVNSVVPALMAGNAVILRPSAQTPLCGERIEQAFRAAGAPAGLLQCVHASHEATAQLIGEVDFVAFTGSVGAGRAVQRSASGRLIGVGLELGGKDPAFVRADADLEFAAQQLVDGAFFNAGQSCCGIERIYVEASVFERFVDAFVEGVRAYRLGDPLDPQVTLGPMVDASAADFVRGQIDEAIAAGARALVGPMGFAAAARGTPYAAPEVLVDVDHSMRLMTEESFGPVVGIMCVDDDDEAVHWMNDSAFGLTASVWTADEAAALAIGARVDTGTWFMNRCDYLDPGLAWTGVKDSGRGCTLSRLGYEVLTRPKSFHLQRRPR